MLPRDCSLQKKKGLEKALGAHTVPGTPCWLGSDNVHIYLVSQVCASGPTGGGEFSLVPEQQEEDEPFHTASGPAWKSWHSSSSFSGCISSTKAGGSGTTPLQHREQAGQHPGIASTGTMKYSHSGTFPKLLFQFSFYTCSVNTCTQDHSGVPCMHKAKHL